MNLHKTGVLTVFILVIHFTDASIELSDPKICYILDGLLILYSIVVTALFFRARFWNKNTSKEESIYSDLNRAPDTYDQLRSPNDPESGTMRSQRQTGDGVYTSDKRRMVVFEGEAFTTTPLQKQEEDPYKQIATKRERRKNKNEQVYQGLTGATRDTYDALHMQPMLPLR